MHQFMRLAYQRAKLTAPGSRPDKTQPANAETKPALGLLLNPVRTPKSGTAGLQSFYSLP